MEEILLRIRKIFLLYLYDVLIIEMETKFSYNIKDAGYHSNVNRTLIKIK